MAKAPKDDAKKKPAAKKKAPAKKKPAAKKSAAKKAPPAPTPDSINLGGETPAPEMGGPLLRILAQYTKDVSFENPNAPDSLRQGLQNPAIELNVEVKGAPMDDNTAEVTLMITAQAMRDQDVAFICELEYSGLFAFANVPPDQIQALILIECPRMLFPFARKIMSDLTQDGGFPPLMLEPLDFAALYRQQNGGAQLN